MNSVLTHARDEARHDSHSLLPNYFWAELRTTFDSTVYAACAPSPNKIIRTVARRLAPAVWRNSSVGLSIYAIHGRYARWHVRCQ